MGVPGSFRKARSLLSAASEQCHGQLYRRCFLLAVTHHLDAALHSQGRDRLRHQRLLNSTPSHSPERLCPHSPNKFTRIHTKCVSPQMLVKMGRKLAFFSQLWIRPYEPILLLGSVHNLARVGGVSVFSLPREFSATDLVIPTRFAACAQYLSVEGSLPPLVSPFGAKSRLGY
jgi:hypothetical protein